MFEPKKTCFRRFLEGGPPADHPVALETHAGKVYRSRYDRRDAAEVRRLTLTSPAVRRVEGGLCSRATSRQESDADLVVRICLARESVACGARELHDVDTPVI